LLLREGMKHLTSMFLVAAAIGCDPPHHNPDAPIDTPPAERHDVLTLKAVQNPDLDVLLVIDDSPSMADKQNALAAAFQPLVAQLQSVAGGLPNLHIGVVTSDMGTSGSGSPTPGPAIGQVGGGGCAGFGKAGALQVNGAAIANAGKFLIANRDGSTNFTGALADVLGQMTKVGDAGCGFEQHLSAMRAALSPSNAANAGFLRESANLAVVILGDEDDCSALQPTLFSVDTTTLGPLQSYRCTRFGVTCNEDITTVGTKTGCHANAASQLVEDIAPFQSALLDRKHGDARMLMLGLIVADPTKVAIELRTPPGGGTPLTALAHSCSYTGVNGPAVGDPAVRMASLLGTFPGRTKLTSVCSDQLAPATTDIGKSIKRLVGDACLEKPIAMPADCVAVDVRDSSPNTATPLPQCGAGVSGDCFDLVADASCTDGAALKLQVTRAQPPPADLWTTVRCTTP
jgi:hypothetical protein